MNTQKTFDCLRMKQKIQDQLRKRWRRLTPEQVRKEMSRFLANSDNSVAVWWRSLGSSKKNPAK